MTKHGIKFDSSAILEFCLKWKIESLSIFGSVTRDDFGPDSDVDFVVVHEADANWDLADHFRMQDELARILGREVDVLDREGIEASENRFLKKEIFSTMEPIYAKG